MVCGLNLIIYLILIFIRLQQTISQKQYTHINLKKVKGIPWISTIAPQVWDVLLVQYFAHTKLLSLSMSGLSLSLLWKNNTSNRGSKDLIVLFCAYWRDIPKIRKLKVTNSLRVSCLFGSLSIPQKNGLTVKMGVI